METTMKSHEIRARAVERCREKRILIPTLAQQKNPSLMPEAVTRRLPDVDIQDVDPLNLFRITWYNDPTSHGFGAVNAFELPPELTGVEARIVGLVGRHFPTGTHKVGAAFGCLVPRLVHGEFDPINQVAVWPSTGNYCRGGAFDSALLGCHSVAILPEEMSQERFRWLEDIGAEVFATPGCESNVKEIFDKCWDLRATRPEAVIFNQFDEFGNYLWHWTVTGAAVEDWLSQNAGPNGRLAGWVGATGSGGTLAAGDYLKGRFPGATITAAEALQCPTLLACGFGGHRIEGIGDKHIPWIHNVRTTDVVTAIDDEATMRLMRLFNEEVGRDILADRGVSDAVIGRLDDLGISSICNLLAAIKTAKYYDLGPDDILVTSFTDSVEMYRTRLDEMTEAHGAYSATDAAVDFERRLLGATTDHLRELTYRDRRAIHNFKYFTWVEQQGRSVEELEELWNPSFWTDLTDGVDEWDEAIRQFNADTGVMDLLEEGKGT